jgi:hypothetical protein
VEWCIKIIEQNNTLAQSTRPVASSWHKDIVPAGRPASIVTPAPFHCQVRDGLEWFQCSKCTKKLLCLVYCYRAILDCLRFLWRGLKLLTLQSNIRLSLSLLLLVRGFLCIACNAKSHSQFIINFFILLCNMWYYCVICVMREGAATGPYFPLSSIVYIVHITLSDKQIKQFTV